MNEKLFEISAENVADLQTKIRQVLANYGATEIIIKGAKAYAQLKENGLLMELYTVNKKIRISSINKIRSL